MIFFLTAVSWDAEINYSLIKCQIPVETIQLKQIGKSKTYKVSFKFCYI